MAAAPLRICTDKPLFGILMPPFLSPWGFRFFCKPWGGGGKFVEKPSFCINGPIDKFKYLQMGPHFTIRYKMWQPVRFVRGFPSFHPSLLLHTALGHGFLPFPVAVPLPSFAPESWDLLLLPGVTQLLESFATIGTGMVSGLKSRIAPGLCCSFWNWYGFWAVLQLTLV